MAKRLMFLRDNKPSEVEWLQALVGQAIWGYCKMFVKEGFWSQQDETDFTYRIMKRHFSDIENIKTIEEKMKADGFIAAIESLPMD